MLEFSTVAFSYLVHSCCEPFLFLYYYFCPACSCMVISLHSGLQIDILRSSIAPQEPPPVLVYHGEGDCVWEITIGGSTFTPDIADGHRLPLLNSFITVKCAVNGTELLNAIIVARG